jgi:hypothetical protein
MKPLCAAIALLSLSACALAAPALYCTGTDVATVEGRVQLAPQWAEVFRSAFSSGMEGWEFDSYEAKLTAEGDEDEQGPYLLVGNEGAQGDTAFELRSVPVDVSAGRPFSLSMSYRANRDLSRLAGHKGHYLTRVDWLDAGGEVIGGTAFGFGAAARTWQPLLVEGIVPRDAVRAVIRLGFDHPNLADGEFLALRDIVLQQPQDPPQYVAEGHFVSRPLRATRGEVTFEADTPPGTVVRLQVASASDRGGRPDVWSPFWGPDGGPDTYYTAPGPLAPIHGGRPWVRYSCTLFADNAQRTPSLSRVEIAGAQDGPWAGPDVEAPRIAERSPTRIADAAAPIWFALVDETGLQPESVRIRLDGQDVTALCSVEDDRYEYRPERPLEPPVAQRWRVSNHQQALSILRTAQRLPDSPLGYRITREAGDTDTAFALTSSPIPIQAGEQYSLSFWTRHPMDLSGVMNGEGTYSGGVIWQDAEGSAVGERGRIDLGPAAPEWRRQVFDLTAPEGATHAAIRLGFDTPNIIDGAFLDIAEVKLDGPRPEVATTDAGPNLHKMTVEAADLAGNSLSEDWYILIREPRTENLVTLRDDGMVLVDSEPFFPIGLYAVWKKDFNDNSFDKAFSDLKAAGFNLAHTYNSGRGADFSEFYAAAQRHGIKLYIASNGGANCMGVDEVLFDVVREEGQPALLAWYLADDTASHVGAEELGRVHRAIRDVDPAHITVQADAVGAPAPEAPQGSPSRYTDYVRSTDGFLPELYPIRDDSDRGVPQIITDMQAVTRDIAAADAGPKTVWAIVQYFQGWGWPRWPTRDELWAMSYLSIIHGAHGMTWYTYGGWGENHGVTDNPEVWGNICALAGELSTLQDALSERTGPQPLPAQILQGPERDAQGHPSISLLLKEHEGQCTLLAANSSRAEVTARIAAGQGKALNLPFEGRTVQADAEGFQDTFAPYAVHVYRWPADGNGG